MKVRGSLVAVGACALVVGGVAGNGASGIGATAIGHVPPVGGSTTAVTDTARQQTEPAITRWYYATAPAISHVEQSITWAQWAARRPQHAGLSRACQRVRSNVHVAQRARQAPDHLVARWVTRELSDFDRAAGLCLAGRLNDSNDSVNAGHHWAYLANTRILRLVHIAG